MASETTLREFIRELAELAEKMPPETLIGARKPMVWSDGDHEVDWDIEISEGPVNKYDIIRLNDGRLYRGPMVVIS